MIPAEIEQRLAASGWTLALTDQSRYLYHMVQRLLACHGWEALHTPYMTRLWLNAGVRKGRAYTLSELRQIAQPREYEDDFVSQMRLWVSGALFKRCVRFKCERCALEQIHPTQALSDPLICAGCLSQIIVPLDVPFAYLPNPLFCVGMINGLLTVLRVLWRLTQEAECAWVGGVMLRQEGGPATEIDLLCLTQDRLLLIEAKDALPEIPTLQMQLLHYHKAAEALGGAALLASLPPVPPDLSAWCADWGIGLLEG